MRITDILTVCFRNLTRRKVRTALTIIGVVIGVCAIILMVSLGIGAKASMEQMLSEWGDLTLIEVYNYGNQGSELKLDDKAVLSMQGISGVELATPYYNAPLELRLESKDGRYVAEWLQVIGVYPEAVEKMGYELTDGAYLSSSSKPNSMVLGSSLPYRFRDTRRKNGGFRDPVDAMGNPQKPFVNVLKDKLSLVAITYDEQGKEKPIKFTPVISGIMKEDWNKGWETSECIFMNINDMKEMVKQVNKQNGNKRAEDPTYNQVRVKCTDVQAVPDVQNAIKAMGFETSSMDDVRENFNKQLNQVQSMLGGLAAISLLVAAIGIANTMVMSIYERTKEIGVMKVIGAEIHDIRTMFLTESAMIGLIGGIVGVGLSSFLSYLMNNVGAVGELLSNIGLSFGMGGKVSVIPWWLVGVAMAFSMLVGVVFGFIPANRAVKISALEAIRHD